MADLDGATRIAAQGKGLVRLAPGAGEAGAQDITSSKRWGPFDPGDYVTVVATEAFFVATGGSGVTASASSTPLPAGAHDFVIPSGVTYVAAFSSTGGAKGACWKS